AAQVDLVRRVNAVLAVRTGPERAAQLRTLLVDLVARLPRSAAPLTVPPRFQPWARARALRMAEQLRAGGYVVHGDLEDGVVPRFAAVASRPSGSTVLTLVALACLDLAGRAAENQQTRQEQRR
ncbi:MAG: hypothetical protein ACRDPB_04210, partial [Nocardioidaceae bacterium]